MTVGEIGAIDADQRSEARQPNDRLREARLRIASPSGSGRPMSQRELAEALTAHVFRTTARVVPLDRHFVSRIERGVRRYPIADYRAAFRAVLGATTDAELGFVRPQRIARRQFRVRPVKGTAVAPPVQALPQGAATQFVVTPGMAVVLLPADHPVLVALMTGEQEHA
jgi:transcriptional regulator with XRE-family HTH domain